jgi:ABC-type metal ion transport system substrate-binding protein
MFMAGLNPAENLLFDEVDNDYALGICINANKDKADEQWVQDLMAAYTSDAACQYVMDYYRGAYRYSEGLDKLKGK